MAVWTKTVEPDRYVLTRDDGLFIFIVHRHMTHFHAEQIMPFDEDGMGRQTPEDILAKYEEWITGTGNTLLTG